MSVLGELLAWWAAQLGDLIPARWRASAGGPANALVFTVPSPSLADPQVIVAERRRRRETERLTLPLHALSSEPLRHLVQKRWGQEMAVVLRPPAASLLEREIMLPLAAAPELDRVLSYEMDRFTPFRSDEVFWAFAVLARDARAGVRLRLSIVPRNALLGLPELLANAGAGQAVIEVAGADGAVRTIDLVRTPSPHARRRLRAVRAAACGCTMLAIAAVAQPFVRQSIARRDVEARMAALRPTVTRAEAVRARIARSAGSEDTIAREENRLGNALEVLAAVTSILPDDTNLTSLTLNDRTLTMEGQSAAAAKLIPRFAGDKLFQGPAFTAPVTRSDHGTDLFALRARIATDPPALSTPLSAPAR